MSGGNWDSFSASSTLAFLEKLAYLYLQEDSDTNPNTTASSVIGDAAPTDGRKRRTEATQLRKSVFGKKHNRLDESKAGLPHSFLNLDHAV